MINKTKPTPSMIPDRLLTVLGPADPNINGIIDAHNHVWIDRIFGVPSNPPVLNDFSKIKMELLEFYMNGGKVIVDCQPGGCGRNGIRLAQLAQDTGVTLVACTGFHRRIYYPKKTTFFTMKVDALTRLFISEIYTGMVETRHFSKLVRAGFIKIAIESTLEHTPQAPLEAAIQAAAETGAAIEIHTERGSAAENILDYCLEHAVPAHKIVLCHMDKRPDYGLHQALAQTGVILEYDTFSRPKYDPENNIWPLIIKMVEAGLDTKVALATDFAESAYWQHYGGKPGLSSIALQIIPRLIRSGCSQETIHRMTNENILNCLAFKFEDKD